MTGDDTAAPVAATVPPAPLPWRRWAECVGFVAVWMALGFVLPRDRGRPIEDRYLLLGIPWTLAFQVGLRGAPIRELWVREAPPFRLGWRGRLATVALAIVPMVALMDRVQERQWVLSVWYLAAIVGSVAAGYAVRHFGWSALRALLLCLVTAGPIGCAPLILPRLGQGMPLGSVAVGISTFALFLPIFFVVEEVTFRGALDAHAHRRGERGGWASALLISALWGVWHLPMLEREARGFGAALGLIALYTLVGVPLSLCCRRGGNLAVPVVVRALIDAVRDALQQGW